MSKTAQQTPEITQDAVLETNREVTQEAVNDVQNVILTASEVQTKPDVMALEKQKKPAHRPDQMSKDAYKRLRRMSKSELSAYINRVRADAYSMGFTDGLRSRNHV